MSLQQRQDFDGQRKGWRLATAAGAIAAALAFAAPGPVQAQGSPTATASDAKGVYARGRILVGARAGVGAADIGRLAGAHGGKSRALGKSGIYVIDLPPQASETAVQQLLARHPQLKFAELDRRVGHTLAVNDPYLGSAWHIPKIGAPSAWDRSLGAGVTIAILDSGVDGSHPDLSARMVAGWNFWDNNNDTRDVLGHGTAVAGTAAATLNNATGVAGVAGGARIMPLRICGPDSYAYFSTIAQGITYAADQGARIASISYANLPTSSAVVNAAQYMKNKGGLVVVSAGNNAKDEGFTPTTAMVVASATGRDDALTSFSSWGSYVTIAAPGIDVWTTNNGGGYGAWWGTSFATPNAAGVIALTMAANPALTSTQVESILYSSATDLGAAGRDKYFGYGRINAEAAVLAAQSATAPAPDATPPTVAFSAPTAGTSVAGFVAVNVNSTDNVGVSKVELRVNGSLLATDTASPYGFSWDSTKVANGTVTLAATAYDAAGNSATTSVAVNVANTTTVVADTTPPSVTIVNPKPGSVKGTVSISSSASDNSGTSGLTQQVFIDGALKASGNGGSLSYNWNTRKASSGGHLVEVVARDAAGNTSRASVSVTK